MKKIDYEKELNINQFDNIDINKGLLRDKTEEFKKLFAIDLLNTINHSSQRIMVNEHSNIIIDFLISHPTSKESAGSVKCILEYINKATSEDVNNINKKRGLRNPKERRCKTYFKNGVFKDSHRFLNHGFKNRIFRLIRKNLNGEAEYKRIWLAWHIIRIMIRRYYVLNLPKRISEALYNKLNNICSISKYYRFSADKNNPHDKPYLRMSNVSKKNIIKILGEEAAAWIVVDELDRFLGRFGS